MKILGISFSPRKDGNTVAMLNEALAAAKKDGAEVELYSVAGKNIQPCDGCWGCTKTGKCHIKDDVAILQDKMIAADGIIFGTPIYFWGMTAQAKAVIDRTISLNQPGRNLNNKVCGVVASCGSLGMVDALKDFSYYIIQRRMLPANQVSAYLMGPDDLKKMPKCLEELNKLGRQMVALVKLNFKYPEEFARGPGAFGTHTK
ncbi:MAG: flavodoxin family protein [Dehalococcoidales bacterium]